MMIKFSTSDHCYILHCYILQNKNKLLLNLKYAYYYLYHNLDIMSQLYTQSKLKEIDMWKNQYNILTKKYNSRQLTLGNMLHYCEHADSRSNFRGHFLRLVNEIEFGQDRGLGGLYSWPVYERGVLKNDVTDINDCNKIIGPTY